MDREASVLLGGDGTGTANSSLPQWTVGTDAITGTAGMESVRPIFS
jgi:hypothetical protein